MPLNRVPGRHGSKLLGLVLMRGSAAVVIRWSAMCGICGVQGLLE